MSLFKKKPACCCSGSFEPAKPEQAELEKTTSGIKVLGGGCAKCNALEAAVHDALNELGMDIAIEHVKDFAQIATYGVMSTPALAINGKVVSYGKVLKKDEVLSILKKIYTKEV